MFARLSAFVIWSLVAATAVFWALRLGASPPPVPPYTVAVGNAVAVRGDLSRLFGSTQRVAGVAPSTPEAPSRFKLVGVMAPRSPAEQAEAGYGLALIAVDGKPAKPYAVGARLDSDLVLQSVGLRTASLGPAQGARSVLLELPVLAAPNSGVLPPPGGAAPTPLPGVAAPVPAAGNTKMQAAQAAVQAAQAAQAIQNAQGGPASQGAPAAQPGFGGAAPSALPGAAPTLGPAQAPVMQPATAATGPALPPPAPSPMPTPGGLPSQ